MLIVTIQTQIKTNKHRNIDTYNTQEETCLRNVAKYKKKKKQRKKYENTKATCMTGEVFMTCRQRSPEPVPGHVAITVAIISGVGIGIRVLIG